MEGFGPSDGDDRRIFWGLKFSIRGFFWVGNFGKYFFVLLDLSRDFGGVQNNRRICGSTYASQSHSLVRIKYNQTCFSVVLMHLFHK